MIKKDIVFISPFKNLYNTAKTLKESRGFNEIEIEMGDLIQGVKVAKKVINYGARVLISRGGTYSAICEEVDIPVVEVGLTSYDILNSFKLIRNVKEPIAIIGYENVIKGYDIIDYLFTDMKVMKVTLHSRDNIEEKIKKCVANGVKLIVGDAVVTRLAPKFGCQSVLIESSEESVANAMEEAIRILRATQLERERMQRFMAVIDYTTDGVIATDKDGEINVFNRHAEEILGKSKEEVIGKKILNTLGDNAISRLTTSRSIKADSLYDIGNTKLAVNHVPIIVDEDYTGSIITFQDVTKIQSLEKKIRLKLSAKGFSAKYTFDNIIYKSEKMKKCIKRAKRYGEYDASVLITGPSGVGKEIFAQSIHNISKRSTGPFVPINCAALPAALIESELFGYVDGAFTGAKKGGKAGIFEMAHGGTIFLDEISELPLELQARLLRVIQEREVMRIGDDRIIPVDVRIICAANQDLSKLVSQGNFRRDLLFRINILTLYIPSLNERREDIKALANFFIDLQCNKYGKEKLMISSEALNYLENYHFEGNVRELRGMMERAVIICDNGKIGMEDIIEDRIYDTKDINADKGIFDEEPTLKELEIQYINYIQEKYNHSKKEVSEILGIDRSTLWRKTKTLGKMM